MKSTLFLTLLIISSTSFCADGDPGPSRGAAGGGGAAPYKEERFYKDHPNVLEFTSGMTIEEAEKENEKISNYLKLITRGDDEESQKIIDSRGTRNPEVSRSAGLGALFCALTPVCANYKDEKYPLDDKGENLFNIFKDHYPPKSLDVSLSPDETTITFLPKHPFYTHALSQQDSSWRTETLEKYAKESQIKIERKEGAKFERSSMYSTPYLPLVWMKKYIDGARTGSITRRYTSQLTGTETFNPFEQNCLNLVCAILINPKIHPDHNPLDFFNEFLKTKSKIHSIGNLETGHFTITIRHGTSQTPVTDPTPTISSSDAKTSAPQDEMLTN